MAKLTGHYFNANMGGYSLFDVDGLKETEKQYKKIKGEKTDGTPEKSYEYWRVLSKDELGRLRQPWGGIFTMYSLREDMPGFRALVIERLTERAEWERGKYTAALALLNTAMQDTKTPPQYYNTIAVDFDGTLCENSFPEIGAPKPPIIEFIKRQAERGAKIILHTCRENGTRRALLDEAVAFCAAHEIPLYAVNENPGNIYPAQYGSNIAGRKVYADLYIDDKARSAAEIEAGLTLAALFVPL